MVSHHGNLRCQLCSCSVVTGEEDNHCSSKDHCRSYDLICMVLDTQSRRLVQRESRTRWKCLACDLTLSEQSLPEHLSSRKHQDSAADLYEGDGDSSSFLSSEDEPEDEDNCGTMGIQAWSWPNQEVEDDDDDHLIMGIQGWPSMNADQGMLGFGGLASFANNAASKEIIFEDDDSQDDPLRVGVLHTIIEEDSVNHDESLCEEEMIHFEARDETEQVTAEIIDNAKLEENFLNQSMVSDDDSLCEIQYEILRTAEIMNKSAASLSELEEKVSHWEDELTHLIDDDDFDAQYESFQPAVSDTPVGRDCLVACKVNGADKVEGSQILSVSETDDQRVSPTKESLTYFRDRRKQWLSSPRAKVKPLSFSSYDPEASTNVWAGSSTTTCDLTVMSGDFEVKDGDLEVQKKNAVSCVAALALFTASMSVISNVCSVS
jgi:hypothetical protein